MHTGSADVNTLIAVIAIEEIKTYTDSDADTIQIVEKKKGQSLGLLLQFNETEKVAYINVIVDNSITSFLVGDQITHINDALKK